MASENDRAVREARRVGMRGGNEQGDSDIDEAEIDSGFIFSAVLSGLSGCVSGYMLAGEFVQALLILLMLTTGLVLGWTARGLAK